MRFLPSRVIGVLSYQQSPFTGFPTKAQSSDQFTYLPTTTTIIIITTSTIIIINNNNTTTTTLQTPGRVEPMA